MKSPFKNWLGILSLVIPLATPASAKSDIGAGVWASFLGYEIARQNRFEELAKIAFLNRAYEENPRLDEVSLKRLFREADFSFRHDSANAPGFTLKSTPSALVERMIDLLRLIPGYGSAAAVATKTALELAQYQTEHYYRDLLPLENSNPREQLARAGLLGSLQDELERAAQNSAKDPLFSKIISDLTQDISRGVTPANTPEQVMLIAPDFADHVNLGKLLALTKMGTNKENDSFNANRAQLTGMAQTQLSEIHRKVDDLGSKLAENLKMQPDYIAYLERLKADHELRRLAVAEAEQSRQEDKLFFEGARASLSLLSWAIRMGGDTHIAQSLERVGSTALRIGDSISQYNQFSSTAPSGVLELAGGAVFTANVLGSVSSLLDFWMSRGQPSSEQLILNGVHRIQKQLLELSNGMEGRFDRVDESLSVIHRDMMQAFQSIGSEVLDSRDGVLDIQQKLRDQERKLSRMDHRIQSLMHDGFGRSTLDTIATCLRQHAPFEAQEFAKKAGDCLALLTTFATVHAKDAVSGQGTDMLNPDDLKAGLMDLPKGIENNLNLVSQAVSVFLDDTRLLQEERKANPVDWALGAQAELKLLQNLGPYRKWISSPEDLRKISKEGERLAALFSKISEGPFSASLIYKALQAYRGAMDQVQAYLFSLRTDFQKRHLSGLDLYGGSAQKAERPLLPSRMERCRDFGFTDQLNGLDAAEQQWIANSRHLVQTTLRTPGAMGEVLPDAVITAATLGLGQINACVSGIGWQEIRDCIRPGLNEVERKCGRLAVRMELKLGGTVFAHWVVRSPEVMIFNTIWNGEHGSYASFPQHVALQRFWEGELQGANVDARSPLSAIQLEANNIGGIESRVSARLSGLQEDFKKEVLAQVLTRSVGQDGKPIPSSFEKDLSAAAGLLRALITLGLPHHAWGDDYLRGLLLGPDGIVDGAALRAKIESNGDILRTFGGSGSPEITRADELEKYLSSLFSQGLAKDGREHPWIAQPLRQIQLAIERAGLEKPELPLDEVIQRIKTEVSQITGNWD